MRWRQEGRCFQYDLEAPPGHHADIHASYVVSPPLKQMPSTSRFSSLEQAREFLVELYAAYASDSAGISRVRIQRAPWNIAVVQDTRQVYAFMQGSQMFPEGTATLDSIFYVRDLPYYWFPLEKLSPTH